MGEGGGRENSIIEKNAKRKNINGVKGHLNICRNVEGGTPPPPPPPTSTAMNQRVRHFYLELQCTFRTQNTLYVISIYNFVSTGTFFLQV